MGLPENRVYTAYPKNCNREKDEPMDLGTQVAVFFRQSHNWNRFHHWATGLLWVFWQLFSIAKTQKSHHPIGSVLWLRPKPKSSPPFSAGFNPSDKYDFVSWDFPTFPILMRKNNMFQKMQAVLCYKMISTILFPLKIYNDLHITYPHKT